MNELINSIDDRFIKDEDFRYFQALVFELTGITLSDKKRDLLLTRLGSYIKNNNYPNYSAYRAHVESLPDEHSEWQKIINLFTTNKTDFFREERHFHFIEDELIPLWVNSKKKKVRIWSSACSTGEEPYSLAMLLEKKLPPDMSYEIFASDIDTNVLAKAQNAVYPILKEPEIPDMYRKSFIQYGRGEIGEWFRIKSQLKEKITFSPFNLLHDSNAEGEKFDLILCRNVMIYFSRQVVEQVACNLYEACADNGYLFIGHSESLQGTDTPWDLESSAIYKKVVKRK